MDLLKKRDYGVPAFLIENYSELSLTSDDVILLIYLINEQYPIVCDYQKMSKCLHIDLMTVMSRINSLVERKFISIELKKNIYSKVEEYISLDLLYEKFFLGFFGEDDKPEEDNIYSVFEVELGRTLSPIEYELLNSWTTKYDRKIIIEALREAVICNVKNFRYIDRILFEWEKKGINSVDKLEKNRNKQVNNKTDNNVVVPDFDWLNSNE